jgi:ADP-ribosylglycohydrolase/fructose-1,6-bisphosphatase/inositol monophosphatase family enzyme
VSPPDYRRALEVAVAAAREAGAHLLAEAHRPGGPRGDRAKCPADNEAERIIRDRLDAAFPAWGIRAEEYPGENRPPAEGERHLWLVDPNDGTSAFHDGARGSAVSIGLIRDRRPVLGVIFAYAAPDDDGDLLAWAEGCGTTTRNGVPLPMLTDPGTLLASHTVAVSHRADTKPLGNAEFVAPARYRPVPGIAYRLALAAAGEVVAATSLFGPSDYDIAGGHALLIGVGGELYDRHGRALRYDLDHTNIADFCFGGAPGVAHALSQHRWENLLGSPRAPRALIDGLDLTPARSDRRMTDAARLRRAQGALLGQLAGDALGSLVEFQTPDQIASRYAGGPRRLSDGGTFNTLAGQPTDDSEMALLLARRLVADNGFDAARVADAYRGWLASGPFDCGNTIAGSLRGHPNPDSQANGALMRVCPLGIFGHALEPAAVADLARADAAITHVHPVCGDANAIYAVTLARAVATGESGAALYDFAVRTAADLDLHPDVQATLAAAADGPPEDFVQHMGWVRIALRAAFHHLRAGSTPEDAVVDTVARGGDTDTNAAIVGALVGAAHGRDAIPAQWIDRVITCRPIPGLDGVRHPRPISLWAVDAPRLAEHLLAVGATV